VPGPAVDSARRPVRSPTNGAREPTTDILTRSEGTYICTMNSGNDNQVDWTAAATPNEGVVPSLARRAQRRPELRPKRNVMDTLLGDNDLAAVDAGGNDPYNATGRQFRR
jgi:hypothetical protein